MADPPEAQQQHLLLPDPLLEEIFVRLPHKEFHQCRCLSRAWADALSSDNLIDRHLSVRGKIRLGYDDLMKYLVFKCCVCHGTVAETESDIAGDEEISEQTEIDSEGDGEISEETKINNAACSEIPEQEESSGVVKEQTSEEEGDEKHDEDDDDHDDDGEDDEEEIDWREEYRTKGYVEVNHDYYIRRAETQAWLAEEWAKLDFSGITFADSDDEQLKPCTIPLGALPPQIRQPLIEEVEEDPSSDYLGGQGETEGYMNFVPVCGREKTEEEVDQEIINFLRRCLAMDPKPQFLKELDRYQWPWPVEEESDFEQDLAGPGDNVDHYSDQELAVEDLSSDS